MQGGVSVRVAKGAIMFGRAIQLTEVEQMYNESSSGVTRAITLTRHQNCDRKNKLNERSRRGVSPLYESKSLPSVVLSQTI